ncbi:MAG: tRNA pseudouridine(38-40) synthase TruA [Propionibacteriales bacterium]|nr:tRNA pseudouridine(38-40) synthase TruA [Propionibacteriales bacterium]
MTPPSPPADTVRLRLDVAYDGTDFSGWADQPGRRTVQGTVEAAIATVLRLPHARLTVAGRTDAGVHAHGQVCHVDLDPAGLTDLDGDLSRLTSKLGRLLPDDVRVRRMTVAPAGFDARFSAVWRRYVYRVCDDSVAADPLHRSHVLAWPRRLDDDAMNTASRHLVGEHDFAAFCKRREGATTIRSVRELFWERRGELLTCRVVADAFCHQMVRSLVGCLLAVGEGRRAPGWPGEVLAGQKRNSDVRVVPPSGLTLEEVGYPTDEELASRASTSRAMRSLG